MYQNYQLQTTARQLVTDLQAAKMSAVAQKIEYQVAFDGTNKRYSINMGNSSLGSTTWTLTGYFPKPFGFDESVLCERNNLYGELRR